MLFKKACLWYFIAISVAATFTNAHPIANSAYLQKVKTVEIGGAQVQLESSYVHQPDGRFIKTLQFHSGDETGAVRKYVAQKNKEYKNLYMEFKPNRLNNQLTRRTYSEGKLLSQSKYELDSTGKANKKLTKDDYKDEVKAITTTYHYEGDKKVALQVNDLSKSRQYLQLLGENGKKILADSFVVKNDVIEATFRENRKKQVAQIPVSKKVTKSVTFGENEIREFKKSDIIAPPKPFVENDKVSFLNKPKLIHLGSATIEKSFVKVIGKPNRYRQVYNVVRGNEKDEVVRSFLAKKDALPYYEYEFENQNGQILRKVFDSDRLQSKTLYKLSLDGKIGQKMGKLSVDSSWGFTSEVPIETVVYYYHGDEKLVRIVESQFLKGEHIEVRTKNGWETPNSIEMKNGQKEIKILEKGEKGRTIEKTILLPKELNGSVLVTKTEIRNPRKVESSADYVLVPRPKVKTSVTENEIPRSAEPKSNSGWGLNFFLGPLTKLSKLIKLAS